MRWHNTISAFLHCSLPTFRAARRTNLALLTTAILSGRELSLSTLARAMSCSALPISDSHRHNKKRLFRFLSNDKIDTLSTQTRMMPHIISAARIKGLTPIMLDWSDLGGASTGCSRQCVSGRGGFR